MERLDRELPVRIRHRFPMMPRYGIDDIKHETVSSTERLEAMSPRMAGRESRVRETEAANPSPDNLRAVASAIAETISG